MTLLRKPCDKRSIETLLNYRIVVLYKKRATRLYVFAKKNLGNVKGMPRRELIDQITIKTPNLKGVDQ
jgi:hypothetical protein